MNSLPARRNIRSISVPAVDRVVSAVSCSQLVLPSTRSLALSILQLLEEKFFDDTKLFQVLHKPIRLVQGGVSGDPEVQKKWKHALIKDDPRLVTNKRGTFAFASSMPNSRTPQFIINLSDNGRMMDGSGPYGMVSLATCLAP